MLRRLAFDLLALVIALATIGNAYAQDVVGAPPVSEWWNLPMPAALLGVAWLITRWKPTVHVEVCLSGEDRRAVQDAGERLAKLHEARLQAAIEGRALGAHR